LAEAAGLIGHTTIRHRGTLGGSLAHADPAAELPAALLALDGNVTVTGPEGMRRVPGPGLFLGYCTTSLAAGEMITEIRVPTAPPRTGWAFVEFTRRHGDFAIVGVAAQVTVDEGGTCSSARIALCGVAPTPVRCHSAEQLLAGNRLDEPAILRAAETCVEAADPTDDIHGSAQYKKRLVAAFAARALRGALPRIGDRS
jgi:CO/xanthine dehydrogenase FAD-binding subunit